jgi:uncharacterized Zn-finger protein
LRRGNAYHRRRQVVNRRRGGRWRDGSAAMQPLETITIDETVVGCDGGGGALGHPLVYLNLAPAGKAECPYCSRLFLNRAMMAAAGPDEVPDAGSSRGEAAP